MKRTLLVVVLIVSCFASYGQGWEWMKGACNVNSENGQSQFKHVATDKWGNVYAAGQCWGAGHIGQYTFSASSLSDIPLVKYDSSGNLKWAKFGTQRGLSGGLALDLQGNLIMFGLYMGGSITLGTQTLNSLIPADTPTFFLTKLDTAGNVLWLKNIGNIKALPQTWYMENLVTTDRCGNIYIAAGYRDTFTVGSSTFFSNGTDDVFLGKFDLQGNFITGTSFGGNNNDWATSITRSGKGNIYITGYFKSDSVQIGGTTLIDTVAYDDLYSGFLVKFDSLTNPLWAKTNQGHINCAALGVGIDDDENAFLAGEYDSDNSGDSLYFGGLSTLPVPNNKLYAFLTMYDSSGAEVWTKCTQGYAVSHKGVVVDHCNNIWVMGNNRLQSYPFPIIDTIDGHPITAPVNCKGATFIAGWNNAGTFITSTILSSGGKSSTGEIAGDNFGNIYLAGVETVDTFYVAGDSLYNPNGTTFSGGGPINMFVAKYSTIYNCVYNSEVPCGQLSVVSMEQSEGNLTVYPNPAYDQLNIETTLNNYDLSLINTLGQVVYTKKSCGNRIAIDVSSFVNGVYYLRVEAAGGEVVTRKVVVQH